MAGFISPLLCHAGALVWSPGGYLIRAGDEWQVVPVGRGSCHAGRLCAGVAAHSTVVPPGGSQERRLALGCQLQLSGWHADNRLVARCVLRHLGRSGLLLRIPAGHVRCHVRGDYPTRSGNSRASRYWWPRPQRRPRRASPRKSQTCLPVYAGTSFLASCGSTRRSRVASTTRTGAWKLIRRRSRSFVVRRKRILPEDRRHPWIASGGFVGQGWKIAPSARGDYS